MESNYLALYSYLKSQYQDLKLLTNQTLLKNKARKLYVSTLEFERESSLFLQENPELEKDLDFIIGDLKITLKSFENNLHKIAKSFIISRFSNFKIVGDIIITEKLAGVQNGVVLEFSYSNHYFNESVSAKYYIKTHQRGGISVTSAASKPVDLKELFVYKSFENLGIGPRIDFFFDDRDPVKEFYIASLESGSNLLEPNDVLKPLWFQFKIASEFNVNEIINEAIESKYKSLNKQLFECLKEEITLVDVMSRIFNVSDCSTNSSNFGFIVKSSDELVALILDFRIHDYLTNSNILSEFKYGNRRNNYFKDSLFYQVLVKEEQNVKFKRAYSILKKFKTLSFTKIIDSSEQDIIKYIENCENEQLKKYFEDDHTFYTDLNDYVQSVKNNFETFFAKLSENAIDFDK